MFSTQAKFESYVRQLHSQLDTTTVTAMIILMVGEARAAIIKQRRLIALERLTERDSTVSLNALQMLEKVNTTLSAALLRETGVAQEDIDDDWGMVVPLRAGGSGAR